MKHGEESLALFRKSFYYYLETMLDLERQSNTYLLERKKLKAVEDKVINPR